MDVGGAWERLLHTPTTWIVVAVVLFVVAVVLLVAGARAGRTARRQRGSVAAAPGAEGFGATDEEDPVTEPAVPRRAGSSGTAEAPVEEPVGQDADEDPVTEPAVPRTAAAPEPAAQRLLGVLVADPSAAVTAVAALERGEQPGSAAVTLLRSGVPAPAVARLCGVDADDLGDLVATALGILPDQGRSADAAATDPGPEGSEEPVDAPERSAAPMS